MIEDGAFRHTHKMPDTANNRPSCTCMLYSQKWSIGSTLNNSFKLSKYFKEMSNAENVRQGAKNVRHSEENVRHCAKNVCHSAINLHQGAKNVCHGA